jgi:CheY-like chemotaxis protein
MKILVVDDEQDIRTLFEQKFRREIRSGELDFAFCYSGEEALQYLGDHFSEVVLILSDINMPGISGFELLRRIRTLYKTPPPTVMLITAYEDRENMQRAKQLGADGFLNKPIDFQHLKEKLNAF